MRQAMSGNNHGVKFGEGSAGGGPWFSSIP